jgi:uncharacterized protein (DUF1015 family)
MHLIRPLRALRPLPSLAAQVAAPPYDVLSSSEARRQAFGNPLSFLHVSKPEIDLPDDIDPYDDRVYGRAAANFQALIARGVLRRDPAAGYYVYRLQSRHHRQTGLVFAASLQAYREQRIRRHELTRPDKETDRVRHMSALGAQTGPAMLVYPESPEIDLLIGEAASSVPDTVVTAADGVRHSIWPIGAGDLADELTRSFDALPALLIADGHHRTAAAERVARERSTRADNAASGWDGFLAVAFPHHEMQLLGYNRLVADLNGLSEIEFLAEVRKRFEVVPSSAPVRPAARGEIGLCLPGRWFRLVFDTARLPSERPAARLDANLLSDQLLGPILAINDLRNDRRIEFAGGDRGLDELESRVASGMAAAFVLYPTAVQDILAVTIRGEVMPPKSTWFEPKLADGLLCHLCDLE